MGNRGSQIDAQSLRFFDAFLNYLTPFLSKYFSLRVASASEFTFAKLTSIAEEASNLKGGINSKDVDNAVSVYLDMIKPLMRYGGHIHKIKSPNSIPPKDYQFSYSCPSLKLSSPPRRRKVPVRVYWPDTKASASFASPPPVLVFFHGGGFILCSVDTHDGICRSIAKHSNCAVVSVDYAQPPGEEGLCPWYIRDCVAAVIWSQKNASSFGFDPNNIILSGDSAGGNITNVLSLIFSGTPWLKMQILLYPLLQWSHRFGSYNVTYPSTTKKEEIMNKKTNDFVWNVFVKLRSMCVSEDESKYTDPIAAPLWVSDEHLHLATRSIDTVIITANFDWVRDEGETLASRIQGIGNNVRCFRYNNEPHGFMSFPIRAGSHALKHLIGPIVKKLREDMSDNVGAEEIRKELRKVAENELECQIEIPFPVDFGVLPGSKPNDVLNGLKKPIIHHVDQVEFASKRDIADSNKADSKL